jgi:Mg/Co/Ni transporter MgtE
VTYTMEDFQRDYLKEHFLRLTPEERLEVLQSLSPEEQCEALERLPPERVRKILQTLEALGLRAFLRSLPAKELRELLKPLPIEERLAGVPTERIQQHMDQLTALRPAGPRKPRRKK